MLTNEDDIKKLSVNTTYSEEAELALHMIYIFISELSREYINYVDITS